MKLLENCKCPGVTTIVDKENSQLVFCRANRLEKYQGSRIFWDQGSTTLQIPLCSLRYVNLAPINDFYPQANKHYHA